MVLVFFLIFNKLLKYTNSCSVQMFKLQETCANCRVTDPDPGMVGVLAVLHLDPVSPERLDPDPEPVNIRQDPKPWGTTYQLQPPRLS